MPVIIVQRKCRGQDVRLVTNTKRDGKGADRYTTFPEPLKVFAGPSKHQIDNAEVVNGMFVMGVDPNSWFDPLALWALDHKKASRTSTFILFCSRVARVRAVQTAKVEPHKHRPSGTAWNGHNTVDDVVRTIAKTKHEMERASRTELGFAVFRGDMRYAVNESRHEKEGSWWHSRNGGVPYETHYKKFAAADIVAAARWAKTTKIQLVPGGGVAIKLVDELAEEIARIF